MIYTNTLVEKSNRPTEVYIEFLTRSLGASREEIIEVTKRSGISARRIAELLGAKNICKEIQLPDLNKA